MQANAKEKMKRRGCFVKETRREVITRQPTHPPWYVLALPCNDRCVDYTCPKQHWHDRGGRLAEGDIEGQQWARALEDCITTADGQYPCRRCRTAWRWIWTVRKGILSNMPKPIDGGADEVRSAQ